MEKKIGAAPCIRSINRWERRYTFKAWTTGTVFHIDQAVYEFTFFEAGKFEFKRGRRFYNLPFLPMIDDRRFLFAHGFYDVLKDRVTFTACGPNVR